MAHVQIKEPVTAQVVPAFVMQGLKETVVKVKIIAKLCSIFLMYFSYYFNILCFFILSIHHG